MSDIQDIIHTTTIKAYESGVKHEQERIIKLLEDSLNEGHECILVRGRSGANDWVSLSEILDLVKGGNLITSRVISDSELYGDKDA
jgi:hypothetical protein